MDLKGQRILISGASGGLGRALAVELGRRGAALALCARSSQGLAETAKLATTAGALTVRLIRGDVSKPQARSLPRRAADALGGLDGLINNAGVHAFASVAEMPESLLEEALQVNLFGALRLTQGSLPYLRDSKGWVANIGSNLGYRSIPNAAAYSATKAALARFTESLRDEESRNGVRVFQMSPGVVITGLRDNALRYKLTPEPQGKLPFPRSAEATAIDIANAIERESRESISAAWPVKVWAKVLAPWFSGMLDKKMRLK